MAELSQPLPELLSKNILWTWDDAQDKAFNLIKAELAKPTILALYDVNTDLKISTNTSWGQYCCKRIISLSNKWCMHLVQ